MQTSFDQFGLDEALVAALKKEGIVEPKIGRAHV